MHKAFDWVELDFLSEVLLRFGFALRWVLIIRPCITNCRFSIIFQGYVKGFLASSHGLRQGGPLSPSLFVLAEDVLSRALNARILPHNRFTTTVAKCSTHLLFADDIIIFSSAKRSAIIKLLAIIVDYTSALGQALSHKKCCFFLPNSALVARIRVVKAATAFDCGYLPFIYLGVPIGPRKRCVRHFQHLIDCICDAPRVGTPNYFSLPADLCLLSTFSLQFSYIFSQLLPFRWLALKKSKLSLPISFGVCFSTS